MCGGCARPQLPLWLQPRRCRDKCRGGQRRWPQCRYLRTAHPFVRVTAPCEHICIAPTVHALRVPCAHGVDAPHALFAAQARTTAAEKAAAAKVARAAARAQRRFLAREEAGVAAHEEAEATWGVQREYLQDAEAACDARASPPTLLRPTVTAAGDGKAAELSLSHSASQKVLSPVSPLLASRLSWRRRTRSFDQTRAQPWT